MHLDSIQPSPIPSLHKGGESLYNHVLHGTSFIEGIFFSYLICPSISDPALQRISISFDRSRNKFDKMTGSVMSYNNNDDQEKYVRYTRYVIAALLMLTAFKVYAAEPQEKRVVATIGVDGVQRVEVVGGDYYFDPNIIIVKVNVPVELVVKKAGGIASHNIVLKAPEAGINFSETLSSKPNSIKFTPTKTGKYPFECTKRFLFFKSHKGRGMHGVLEVVE